MSLQQITAADIAGWNSLGAIADSFEKRGLKPRPNLGEDNEGMGRHHLSGTQNYYSSGLGSR